MLGFYGWRSGIDIAFEHDGRQYRHTAGHLDDGLLDYIDDQQGVVKDGTGGWYDAGDYGKYLPTASVSVNSMLSAWEQFGDKLESVELPFIPEHEDGVLPDFLSELKWELDWMLKMAYDDGSGRVHHKLNSPNFPQFVLPADDPTTRYFASFSSAATGEFVASMAKAARAFAPYDELTDGYSQKLLEAALVSYAYLTENPENVRYDDSVLRAGAYQKDGVSDRLWAAAELWETLGDDAMLADFENRIGEHTAFVPNFDWDSTAHFGLLTYVLSSREGRDPDIVAQLEASLLDTAEDIVRRQTSTGYGRGFNLYYWGSNGVTARLCMVLQAANLIDPDQRYLNACAAQVAYLYGRNQYNRSQITGSGIDPPLHPHHRPSGADNVDAPYPGLLVGGGVGATTWKDEQGDARSNEVAINWNSALVYALAGLIEGTGTHSLGRGPVPAESCHVRVSSVGYLPELGKLASVQENCELPSNFECDLPESTLSGDTQGSKSLIDDLEDEDTQILASEGRSGSWFAFDDESSGTHSGVRIESAQRRGSSAAVCISGEDFAVWGGGMGFALAQMGSARQPYDASEYTGVSFWAKGSSTEFRVMLVDKYSDPGAGQCASCNDHFYGAFTPSSAWQRFTFAWPDLEQRGFGDAHPNVCPAELRAIQFQWPANEDFELCLDDIAFTTHQGTEQEPVYTAASGGGGCGCRLSARPPAGTPLGLLGLFAMRLTRRRAA